MAKVNYLEKIRLLEQDLNFNGIFINRSKIAELYTGFRKSSESVRVEYVRKFQNYLVNRLD